MFYTPELIGQGEPHGTEFWVLEMQKSKILKNRAQRVDEENRVICLVMFTLRVKIFKVSKMSHFVYFLQMTAKNQSQFGQNI